MSNKPLFEIPEFTPITEILNCENCSGKKECKSYKNMKDYLCSENSIEDFISSKYDCENFLWLVFWIKILVEIASFITCIALSMVHFHTFWKTSIAIFSIFIVILFLDWMTDKIIYKICKMSEEKRKNEYNQKVKTLQGQNEAIQRANAGITEEVDRFLKYSDNMLNELIMIYNSVKDLQNLQSKEGERVLKKLEGVNSELAILNKKLSTGNIESSYISTLYKVHLPKLLEYSRQFEELLNNGTATVNQIVKFSDLLEVFRIKIANHTQYLKDKAEDDFIIKITALNEDVMPEFDGSEVDSNE